VTAPSLATTPSTTPRNLRVAAAGVVGAAVVWPFLPVHPPFACPLRVTTGIPCPLCGMTRAGVAMAQADVVGALRYNPGVILLVAVLAVALLRPAVLLHLRLPVWVLGAALGALWIWNVGFNPTFDQYFF
jgi:hypothetical protein